MSADVARVVRGILAERKVNTKDFARMAGIPASSVDRWLWRGGTFSVDSLEAMADALGMTSIDLMRLALGKRQDDPVTGDGQLGETGS